MAKARLGLAGFVRSLLIEIDGVETRGTRQFAPETLVYVHPPRSGDGWARTYVTGVPRDGGELVSVYSARSRVGREHRRVITDPEALGFFLDRGFWEPSTPLPAFSYDPDEAERAAGWALGAWDALTARCLAPDRPALTACVAALLDLDANDVAGLVARGEVGRAITEASAGAPVPDGRRVIRRVREAWEALAPIRWTQRDDRRFEADTEQGPALREHPSSVLGVASFCALDTEVETIEALAREFAVASGASADARIVWQVVPRSSALHRLSAVGTPDTARAKWTASVRNTVGAIHANDLGWRAQAVMWARAVSEATGRDPFAPLLSLAHRGVAVENLTRDRIDLVCPTLGVRKKQRREGSL